MQIKSKSKYANDYDWLSTHLEHSDYSFRGIVCLIPKYTFIHATPGSVIPCPTCRKDCKITILNNEDGFHNCQYCDVRNQLYYPLLLCLDLKLKKMEATRFRARTLRKKGSKANMKYKSSNPLSDAY